MSLLLDALKKAAEQKAEKSKQEEARARPSDETVVDTEAAADDEDRTDVRAGPPRYQARDETQIDDSDIDTRLEQTRGERDPGDETGLDVPDATATDIAPASAQMQTGEDETIIFDDDDVSDFIETSQLDAGKPRAREDETDLSQLAEREDATDVSEPAAALRSAADDTDISRPLQPGDQTDVRVPQPPREETDLLDELVGEDETDISEPIHTPADLERVAARRQPADDTDLSRVDQTSADTDVGADGEAATAEPDPSLVGITESGVQFEPDPTAVESDDTTTGVDDSDLSLLLVERDQTNLTSPTSATDPQPPRGQPQALQPGNDDLGLVDTTREQLPGDETTTRGAATRSSATTGINYDTQGTTARAEPTSTRTYAPDNYDRTLMRLPSDDASRLFAGMKSDSEVVMTPDYAKKVFQSKSSAQRVQHYKFYAGIAVVILLGIGIYGAFEYQSESLNIDNSLQPLKRDPMPGMLRPEQVNQKRQLFTEPTPVESVDERTMSIVQSAGEMGEAGTTAEAAATDAPPAGGESEQTAAVVAATDAPAETPSAAGAPAAVDTPAAAQTPAAADATAAAEPANLAAADAPAGVATGGSAATASAQPASNQQAALAKAPQPAIRVDTASTATRPSTGAASGESAGASRPAPAQDAPTLQISSSTRVADKSIWLRQAYEAYLAGNDELALELYNKVLKAHPQNRNALLARAAIHVQNKNASAAIADYQTLLEANPKDSLAMASLISVANVAPAQAETQLKLMLRDEPGSPYLNFALANAYGAQNRWQEAQGYYFRALQANPGDPNYAYNLAVSLEHISQPRAAIAYYRRALDNINNGLATFNKNLVEQRLEVLEKS